MTTTEKEVIHVGLYGGKSLFGGRETPLEARVVSCGMADKCSIHAAGQCVAINSIGRGCKHGTKTTKKGFTSRAKKYYEFKNKWKNHEKYAALKDGKKKLAIIGKDVYFNYSYIDLEVKEEGRIQIGNMLYGVGTSTSYIPVEQFDEDFIYRVCEYRPEALMGGTSRAYEKEEVPTFLGDLKALMPELYKKFLKKYPKYNIGINYEGRKALLHSLEPCLVEDRSERYPNLNSTWEWDGEYLNYEHGYVSTFGIVRKYEVGEIQIKPGKEETVTITDNNQVTESTVFVD